MGDELQKGKAFNDLQGKILTKGIKPQVFKIS